MRLVQLIVPAEAAHGTARRLGALGCVELKDLNSDKSAFQRTYANQVHARESPPAPPRGGGIRGPRAAGGAGARGEARFKRHKRYTRHDTPCRLPPTREVGRRTPVSRRS